MEDNFKIGDRVFVPVGAVVNIPQLGDAYGVVCSPHKNNPTSSSESRTCVKVIWSSRQDIFEDFDNRLWVKADKLIPADRDDLIAADILGRE